MRLKKTMASVTAAAVLAGGGAYMLQDAGPEEFDIALFMVPILAAINRCTLARPQHDAVFLNEMGPYPGEDPDGWVSNLGVALSYMDDINVLWFGADSPHTDAKKTTQQILTQYGSSIKLYGHTETVDALIETAANYCPENRLRIAHGNEVISLSKAMKKAPDLGWEDKVRLFLINGSNKGHPRTSKRIAWDHVHAVMNGQHFREISEAEFRKLFTHDASCSVACLNAGQRKIEHGIRGIRDHAGELITGLYYDRAETLNAGQVNGSGQYWREADSIALCLAADFPINKCNDKRWVIARL